MVGLANLIGFGFQWGLAEIVGARLTRKLRFEMFSSILRQVHFILHLPTPLLSLTQRPKGSRIFRSKWALCGGTNGALGKGYRRRHDDGEQSVG